MIELVIDDEVVNVPEEITLGIYQEMNKNPERYKNPLQTISLITGLSVHELKNLNKDQIQLIEGFISTRFIIPDEKELVLTFEHNGIEYGLENDWSKMAWGAWVDLEVYSAEENIHQNLDKIMSVLYRPIISKDKKDPKKYTIVPYKSEEIEPRAEIMKIVPVRYWLGVAGFFFQVVSIYINNIKSSLNTMNKQNQWTMKGWKMLPKWLQKKLPLGSILLSPTNSQKKILQNLTK
jgi:hypothetical protein